MFYNTNPEKMFTGIITEIGKVKSIEPGNNSIVFLIEAKSSIKGKEIGQSIAVNGVCTTIIELSENHFKFEAINETLERSNFRKLKKGMEVNLEPALTLEKSIDGHLVQGHVDETGEVIAINSENDKNTIKIKFPGKISKYLAFKGSITVNGVSLTIADLQDDNFSIELTAHTMANTTFRNLKKEDLVNLETDLIARHLERLLQNKETETSYQYLKDRNFI